MVNVSFDNFEIEVILKERRWYFRYFIKQRWHFGHFSYDWDVRSGPCFIFSLLLHGSFINKYQATLNTQSHKTERSSNAHLMSTTTLSKDSIDEREETSFARRAFTQVLNPKN